ncbi:hypothetical protein J6590_058969 [Homalodisca vitripennis]|nr:hypothetical protein J6590_058969 [Homalodisca vitripennis]
MNESRGKLRCIITARHTRFESRGECSGEDSKRGALATAPLASKYPLCFREDFRNTSSSLTSETAAA